MLKLDTMREGERGREGEGAAIGGWGKKREGEREQTLTSTRTGSVMNF